jgi:hypothetical protein
VGPVKGLRTLFLEPWAITKMFCTVCGKIFKQRQETLWGEF